MSTNDTDAAALAEQDALPLPEPDVDIDGPTGPSQYLDEWDHHMGFCNACDEEAELDTECCDDGEVVPYEDDRDPYDQWEGSELV